MKKRALKIILVLVFVLSLTYFVYAAYPCSYCEVGMMQPQNDTIYDVEWCPNPTCEISVTNYATWDECDFSPCGEIENWNCTEISRYHIEENCPYQ